jgi:putative glutathione S-transferase
VPILFDTKTGVIVSNSSIDIAIMIATQFTAFQSDPSRLLIPSGGEASARAGLQSLHGKINIAVYQIHFQPDQREYERKVVAFYGELDALEAQLSKQTYVTGETLSLLDLSLFATLVRLPLVYATMFRVSLKCFNDKNYPNLCALTRRLYEQIGSTVDMRGILTNYYTSAPLNAKSGKTIPMVPMDTIWL